MEALLWKIFRYLHLKLRPCCHCSGNSRSIFSSDATPEEESETVEPFARADILYNRNVDKIAARFETTDDAAEPGITIQNSKVS